MATLVAACGLPLAIAQTFDPAHTRIGFELRTRWNQKITGVFRRYEGDVRTLDDGRRQVRMSLDTDAVEIIGHANYTAFARGSGFFDARRYPQVTFVSDPYPPRLLQDGGDLYGTLTMHGVRRREHFQIEPARCARPARDCDLVARGSIRREDYNMDRWQMAVRGRVHFTLAVRLHDDPGAG